jgi:glucose-1-phosphate adenylyltransferase
MKLKPDVLAMVLAGGRVDELSVLTAYRPKSAVPFGGFARVIDFTLTNLMQSGLERVAILSQFRSFSLINHIGIGAAWDMIGRYRGVSILPPSRGLAETGWYRGTADAIFQNLDFIKFFNPEILFILSGDHLYHLDYQDIITYHREKDADLTVACVEVPMSQAHRFGVAAIDNEDGARGGRVVNYSEKPLNPQYNWASMTIYCFRPSILYPILKANARDDSSFEFGRDIIPRMLEKKHKVYGYKFKGYWGYTRTIEEYWQANMDLLGPSPKLPIEEWGIRSNLEHRNIRDCQPVQIGNNASIENSLVYNGCIVEGHVENSVLFPGVRIAKDAVVKDSVLLFNTTVGNAVLQKVVSDVNVVIDNNVRIGAAGDVCEKKATVVGWNNHIPKETVIGSDCIIHPALEAGRLPRNIGNGETVK